MSKQNKNKTKKESKLDISEQKPEIAEKVSLQRLMQDRYNETLVNYLSNYLKDNDEFQGHFHDMGIIYGQFGKQNAYYFFEKDNKNVKWCLTSNDPVVHEMVTQYLLKSDELVKIWKDKESKRWKFEFVE